MKLVFICTSLQPGRDGVGDYVRLLASGCADQGHTCALIAINDQHLDVPARQEMQSDRGHEFPALRLSPQLTWTVRCEHARAFVQTHAPDWISWQLVPYGFHPKGVIPDSAFEISQLGRGRFNHVMLHELWIGISQGEPFKNRVYGFFQRRALKELIRHIQPVAMDTSNPAYRAVLLREGFAPGVLPLCGNIPVEPMPPAPASTEWVGGIFGTVHPQFDPHACLATLHGAAQTARRSLRIVGFGRLGAHGERLFAQLAAQYAGKIAFENLGERSSAEISRLLQTLDFGIGTHPWALIGKSGAVAAMLDHGVPVIVPREDWALRVPPTPAPLRDPLVVKLSQTPVELVAGWLGRRRAPQPRLSALTQAFLARLQTGVDYSEPHP